MLRLNILENLYFNKCYMWQGDVNNKFKNSSFPKENFTFNLPKNGNLLSVSLEWIRKKKVFLKSYIALKIKCFIY